MDSSMDRELSLEWGVRAFVAVRFKYLDCLQLHVDLDIYHICSYRTIMIII